MRFFLLAAAAVFLLGISHAAAIGVSPAIQKINFVPNYTGTFTFAISGAQDFDIRVEGEEAQYFELKPAVRVGDYYTVDMVARLPEDLMGGGEHSLNILVLEKGVGGGGIRGLTGVNSRFTIIVPYRGLYVTMFFEAQDANAGEDVVFFVKATNSGEEAANVKARVDIFQDDKLVETADSEEQELKSTQETTLSVALDSSKKPLKPGNYKAIATLFYNDKTIQKEDDFRVGGLDLQITNYTKQMFSGEINPAFIEVESLWNSRIENLYADLNLFNSTGDIGVYRTVTTDIDKWERKRLTTHIDAGEIGQGNYTNRITIHFGGDVKEAEYNMEVIGRAILTQENSGLLVQVAILFIIGAAIWISARGFRKKVGGSKGKRR